MTKFNLVLFDLGGVLIDWHDSLFYHEVSKRLGIPEDILAKECENEISKLHAGKIQELEFWNVVGQKINVKQLIENDKSYFREIFQEKAKINQSLLSTVEKIRNKGTQVGLLSNLENVTHSILSEWQILDGFEYQFFSHKIGFAKPDRRIFEYVIKNVPLKKEQLFFIDDKLANIETARSVGIQGIQYFTTKKLLDDLQKFEIL